jgi:ABC-2 type transport system ATP-binding protein
VIRLERVAARLRPLVLANVSIDWGAGVHVVLGAPSEGGPLLLGLLAGSARVRSGTLEVLGGTPTEPSVRKQVGRVPYDPVLPDALRVDEALDVAASIRGEPPQPPETRLATLGVEALAPRKVSTLSRPEARAVALAEAVTSQRVRLIVAEEPLAEMDPRAVGRVTAALRGRADAGCAVVVQTASRRDAARLGDDFVLLRAGGLAGRAGTVVDLEGLAGAGARLRLLARDDGDARAICAALVVEADVSGVEQRGCSVAARGSDAVQLARAAERAILAADKDVTEMSVEGIASEEARP